MKRKNDLEELRQTRWELRRAHRAAAKLAELLEMASRRTDYTEVRALEARLLTDLMALDGADELR